MRISPRSGASSDASISSSVVFPAPFGPTSPVTLPLGASKVASRTACTDPKDRPTPLAMIPLIS
jgi:hypothetical protein